MSNAHELARRGPRGRELFRRFRPALEAASTVFRYWPEWLLDSLWQWSDLAPRLVGVAVRYCLARARAEVCGDNVMFDRGVEVRTWSRLVLGSNVSVNRGCYLDAAGGLIISDDVSIAHQVSVITTNHTWGDTTVPIRDNPLSTGRVRIERDVWIGCGCRILAGVTIRSRSVIAAGAVVIRDVPEGSVAAGVPAKVIKSLPLPTKSTSINTAAARRS